MARITSSDIDRLEGLFDQLDKLQLKTSQTCSDVVVEHSKILVSVGEGVNQLKESFNKIDKKIDEVVNENRETSTRLTKIETEKKTAIAFICSIGSIILTVATSMFKFKTGI